MMAESHSETDKFAELMLYIAHRCRNVERFGSVKLSKILYFCDFEAFRRFQVPITGTTYLKKSEGPLPEGFYETRSALSERGLAEVERRVVYDFEEERLVPKSEDVDLGDKFNDEERRVIDSTIDSFSGWSAKALSDYSHGEFGWEHAQMDQPIPYSTALIARSDNPILVQWLASRAA